MINVTHLVQATAQAPWRVQRQWVGAFLLGLLAVAMVAALYLDVTARAAITGREIQDLHAEITSTQQLNADLQTQLASLLSTSNMEQRALVLGFRPAEAGEIHYLIVPGFYRPPAVSLAATQTQPAAAGLPAEYTQSLLDWIAQFLNPPASGLAGGVAP